ncbi:MAG: DUF2530 domain-containing protein [Leifsonia sp.]|jgi:hypothetical protein
MRLWLRDDERRPDPVPAKTDDRRAVLVGLVLWVVALIVVLAVGGGGTTAMWTVVVGLALGALGMGYLTITRRRR